MSTSVGGDWHVHKSHGTVFDHSASIYNESRYIRTFHALAGIGFCSVAESQTSALFAAGNAKHPPMVFVFGVLGAVVVVVVVVVLFDYPIGGFFW